MGYGLLWILCLGMLLRWIYNAGVIFLCENGYSDISTKPLQIFNVIEPYVADYNQGNIHYQRYEYYDAIMAYDEALSKNPPQEKECSIRINKALALISILPTEYKEPANRETSLEILYSAKSVLLEGECATEDGDGHSETAETLKEEIEQMIKELEQMKSEEMTTSTDENGESSDDETSQEEEQFEEDVKKTIQEKQSKANEQRNDEMRLYEDMEKDFNFDYEGQIW